MFFAAVCSLACIALFGESLDVAFDRTNGGVASIVLNTDTNRMNWVKGTGTWGTIRAYSVTMLGPDGSETGPAERGEHFDAWSNDQYAGLYYMLRYSRFRRP